MEYVAAAFVATFGVLAILGGLAALRNKANRQAKAHEHAVAFFRDAEQLIADSDVPPELSKAVKAFSHTISKHRMARLILQDRASGRWGAKSEEDFQQIREFWNRRPDAEQLSKRMALRWFFAVTYLAPISGPILRATIAEEAVTQTAVRTSRRADRMWETPAAMAEAA